MNRSQYDPLEDEDTLRILQNLAQLKGQSNRRQVLTGQMPIPEPENNLFNLPGTTSRQGAPAAQGAPPSAMYEDIRANQVNTPQVKEKQVLSQFGKALGDLVQTMQSGANGFLGVGREAERSPFEMAGLNPSISPFEAPQASNGPQIPQGYTEQQRKVDLIPPVEAVPPFLQNVSLSASRTPESVVPSPVMPPKQLPVQQSAQNMMASTPEEVNQIVSTKAGEPPGSYAVPGAASLAFADPQTKASIERLIGEKLPPEALSILQKYEAAAEAFSKGVDVSIQNLDPEVKAIEQRLASRNLSRQDMIMMGAVLLAPAIISGLMGGREAALSSIAGGSQALAQGLQKKEEGLKEDEQRLSQLGIERAGLLKSKLDPLAKLAELKKPGKPGVQDKFRERLAMQKVVEGENGQAAIEIQGLRIPLDKIRDESDLDLYKKEKVPEALKDIKVGKQTNDTLNHYIGLLEQIAEPGYFETYLGTTAGNLATKASQVVGSRAQVKMPDGRMVDAQTALDQIRGLLKTDYANVKKMRQMTENVVEHFDSILKDPFKMSNVSGSIVKNALDQARALKKSLNSSVINALETEGIDASEYRRFIEEGPVAKKEKIDEQGYAITQWLLNNPQAQEQASQTGKFMIGE
jgi:hypothetical protein